MDNTFYDYIHRMELEGRRIYRLTDHFSGKQLLCGMPPKSCVFCKHCTSVLWDSNGPYLTLCKLHLIRDDHEVDCPEYLDVGIQSDVLGVTEDTSEWEYTGRQFTIIKK